MEDAAATALKSFDANSLQKLLTQSGPTCKCVFVPCEAEASVATGSSGSSSSSSTSSSKTGVPVEVSLDMTPKVCAPALQLGGCATICASYDDIDVIVMKLREPAENTPVNPHKLPAPFQEFVVKGPILFVRMDQNSEPKDFSPKIMNKRPAITDQKQKIGHQRSVIKDWSSKIQISNQRLESRNRQR